MRQYSIFDKVTEKYSPLDGAENDKTATRKFIQFLKNQPKEVKEDFEMWYIGDFDEKTGILTQEKMKQVSNQEWINID